MPHSHPAPPPLARPTKQARSQETLVRLLDAAEALIEEKGLQDVSIPDIVARAGSSVGGFYARFRDKGALLRALEERFFLDVSRRIEALADASRWAAAPLRDVALACAGELVAVTSERRNLIAAFLLRAAQDTEVWGDGLRLRHRAEAAIARLLRGRPGELTHPDPERAVPLAVQFAFGLVLQRALTGEVRAAGRALSDGDLRDEIARNFLGYLGASGAAPPTSPRSDAAPRTRKRRGTRR